MKRTISTLLAVMMALTAFGVSTLMGGVIGASAVFFDYYEYTQFPGLDGFNGADFELAWKNGLQYSGLSSDYLPDGNPVAQVTTFTVTTPDKYGGASLGTMRQRNADPENNTQNADYHNSPNWTANDALNGKDIFGDSGVSFDEASGFCFWVGLNGGRYDSKIKVALFAVPSQGPYYVKSEDGTTDMGQYIKGFVYSSEFVLPDEDGYYYFNFRTDFGQTDWWSTDDNGVNQKDAGRSPVPDKTLPYINALEIRFNSGLESDSVLYIGDFRVYRDTRVYIDELDELCRVFEAINSEEYTEESYSAALEIYLAAYEMLQNASAYSQKRINAMAVSLNSAIRDLKPMFYAEMKSVKLAGFEVWDDEDLDEITGGGLCLDTPAVEEESENTPLNKNGVLVFANAVDGEPTYGWSLFTNATDEDGDLIADGAVKNPFELLEGSAPLSEASGIRFWIKWDESLASVPNACRIGLGVSSEELYFECEDSAVRLPEEQGYIGAAWTAFYDMDGDEDIFDYIDELDSIYIYLEGAVGIYYIADLTGFEWSFAPADFTELIRTINEAKEYMKTLNKSDYYFVSWNNVENTIAAAEALIDQYAVTDEDVAEMIDSINKSINWLTPLGDLADEATIKELQGLCQNGKTYWRGNVTARSYVDMQQQIENAEALLYKGPKQAEAEEAIAALRSAIANLVPIKAGEKVTSIYSFESYSSRELNRATGDRTENTSYTLDSSFPKLPEGYAKALKMTAQADMSSETTDEHGMMQFKAMYRDAGNHVNPLMMGTSEDPKANTLIGDLSGTDGLCLWVGVNDVNLVQTCTMRFAVSNCQVGPLFERAAINIPIPATGQGWIFLPWEYFEYYDAWTKGEEINLAKIYFYIIRFDGSIKQGLEVYVTGIHAYKNTTSGEWDVPVIANVAEGANYDVSEQELIPDWNVGAAMLDGEALVYGNPVVTNGEHTLVVTNGDKSATVNFTTTGAVEYATPVANIENGAEYVAPLTVSWDVGEATLNGEPFENGGVVEAPGGYMLEIVNGTKSVSIRFTVKDDSPVYEQPVISGVADGEEYEAAVSATWTPADATATLNGEAYAAGAEISAPGEYTLVVTNGDKSATVSFTIKAGAPAVKRGDMDGDNEITVADALRALRIAAKLVAATDNDVATGDIDKDGDITVADALKILRVAAKLADESSLA